MARAIVGRWGKNLAVPIPAEIAMAAHLRDGERVEIAVSAEDILIRRLAPEPTLESMFAGMPPEVWRALYRDAYDCGPDQGRERVDE
jgi:antitoxin MazE